MPAERTKAKQRARNRAVRELPEEDPDFQIAPMIDVLLVLLVFFMSISSTEVLQSAKGIELPVGADAQDKTKSKGQVIITVAWNNAGDLGGITIDERPYASPADIVPLLKARLAENPQTRVLLRADKATRYAFTRAIMAAAAAAGVVNVTFSVVDKVNANGPAAAAVP